MNIRGDFPILAKYPKLIYFDSACTSFKPNQVIDAEAAYYKEFAACAGRSSHNLGKMTTEKFDACREIVADFLGADNGELIWTRNATESLNIVANAVDFSKRRRVVTSVMEHHSVLLPLMKLRDAGEIELEVVPCSEGGEILLEKWRAAIDNRTALVVTNNGNNTSGKRQNAVEVAKVAHDAGALICIDGAQGVAHSAVDFKRSEFDFLCFSGHKMLGPTGIGGLVVKEKLLDQLNSFLVGGGTVKTVSLKKAEYATDYTRFEAGIQNYAGVFGLAAACNYLKKIGMKNLESHEAQLSSALQRELQSTGVKIYGSTHGERSALFTFNFSRGKPHEVALMLDKHGIAVRSGFFCAQTAVEALGAKQGAVRASCYIYNTVEEVKIFGEVMRKIAALYS